MTVRNRNSAYFVRFGFIQVATSAKIERASLPDLDVSYIEDFVKPSNVPDQ